MIKKIGKGVDHLLTIKKNCNRLSDYEANKTQAANFLKDQQDPIDVDCCPVCGLSEISNWFTVFNFIYQQCHHCGLVFLNPSPNAADLERFYTFAYDVLDVSDHSFDQKVSDLRIKNIVFPRIQFIKQFINPHSWLDLGSGNGEMIYGLKISSDNQMLVEGVEINKNSIDFAKKNYDVALRESRAIDYVKNNNIDFDVVSLFGLLEHLSLPRLKEITEILSRKMKPGAVLALLVPVADSYSSFLQKANNKLVARHLVPPAHITLWGEKSLNIFLNNNGFDISGTWNYGQDCFELFYHLKEFLTPDELTSVLSSMSDIQGAIDKAGLSDEILIIAKKR